MLVFQQIDRHVLTEKIGRDTQHCLGLFIEIYLYRIVIDRDLGLHIAFVLGLYYRAVSKQAFPHHLEDVVCHCDDIQRAVIKIGNYPIIIGMETPSALRSTLRPVRGSGDVNSVVMVTSASLS